MRDSLRLMFCAGENSGDQHASRLIRELDRRVGRFTCFGYGGERMAAAGMRLDQNLAQELPIIGLGGAFRNYGRLKALLERATDLLKSERPDALVPVDYPGFNLQLAARAHELGIPVIYYISPQVWAWHRSRVTKIRQCVRHMMVILPFEEAVYREAGVAATYVGHPLADRPPPSRTRAEALAAVGLAGRGPVIALIPGSREGEISRHLPIMLDAARLLRARYPDSAFVVPRASTVGRELLEAPCGRAGIAGLVVAEDDDGSLRSACDFAICKSGTSTLELAMMDVPMVIVYLVSMVTEIFARTVVRIPHIGLVNIVAGREVAPELLQRSMSPQRVAGEVSRFLDNPADLASMREGLALVRERIGGPGASGRAAETIIRVLGAGA